MPPDEHPYNQFLSRKYFASLDGLRCLSIVMVIWSHTMTSGTALVFHGLLGVQLFFVISGFLITTLLLREQEQTGRISMKGFYIRRTLRIFPLYYAVLGLYVVLVLSMRQETSHDRAVYQTFLKNLPSFATYTTNWFVDGNAGGGVIFNFSWSLATEEQFYLFWPWVVRYFRRWFAPLIVASLLILLDQSAEYLILSGRIGRSNLLGHIVSSLATSILLGCILASLLHRRTTFLALYRILGQKWSAPLAMLLLGFNLFLPRASVGVIVVLMTCVVGSCCVREDHWLRPILANSLARYVGTISYGMYLLHMLGRHAARLLVPAYHERMLLQFLAALVITIAVASMSYRVYEQPFLRLKNRFRSEPQPVDHAPEAEVPAVRPA